MAYVGPSLGRDEIRRHQREHGNSEPAIHDWDRALVSSSGATVTPESAVFGESGRFVYRGRINSRYASLGTVRQQASEQDLRNAENDDGLA